MVAFLDLVEVVLILSSISDVALSVGENVVIVLRRVYTIYRHTECQNRHFQNHCTHTNGNIVSVAGLYLQCSVNNVDKHCPAAPVIREGTEKIEVVPRQILLYGIKASIIIPDLNDRGKDIKGLFVQLSCEMH